MSRFIRNTDFSSLSLKDLLEAREVYHVHLANLENVVGTAVGRYRIRYDDPNWKSADAASPSDDLKERNLGNSGVRPWSWPCVLVFVDQWAKRKDFAQKPSNWVPPRLYLPDGRVVPTCVIHAPRRLEGPPGLSQYAFPAGLVGGGYPVFTDAQGAQRVGSLGCLVSDGYYTYALTSRHVIGDPGTEAYIYDRGERHVVALAHKRAVEKLSLLDAYPGFPGLRTTINVDAGLFCVKDMSEWTSQVYGIGRVGELINLCVDTLSLDLIGCPVRANGGASGQLSGEIQGLFYRYRSVGGFDYVAEFLIGPRQGEETVTTRPGDSGTLWFWDEEAETQPSPGRGVPELRPIALQWGGHSFLESGGQAVRQFALASNLATVCRALDVEIVRDWSIDHSLYWGKVGHYKIAVSACALASIASLNTLLLANAEDIAVSDQDISTGNLPAGGSTGFIALADVPDLAWRASRKMDQANHFADMDQPGGAGQDGPTLIQLWDDPANRTPAKWTEFYDSLPERLQDKSRGALPFRIRQFYEAMVDFVRQGDVARYVCAAGVLAHYVGDACQPLHISRLHHGRPETPEESDVHGFYETRMLDRFAPEVVSLMNTALENVKVSSHFQGGAAAADRAVQLMKFTLSVLDPETLVDTWVAAAGPKRNQKLWEATKDGTIWCMAAGALCLAEIWESAWIEGTGDHNVNPADLKQVGRKRLMQIYKDRHFVESKWLKNMTFA